jgi:predicted ATPase
MPHLLRLSFKHGPPEDDAPFPFSVPQIRTLPTLDMDVPVTFFVGENGAGNSMLLEGIAEDFFGRIKWLARNEARRVREQREVATGPRANAPAAEPRESSHPDERAIGFFLQEFDSRSHGDSLMDLFAHRIKPGGLYLLDEPEAALSPKRQIALIDLLERTSRAGAQFIIATHSPILLACPGARIHSFDETPIAQVAYEDLEHVSITRNFLNDPDRFIER